MKNPSVMIGIPSGDDWKADFGMCLAGIVASAPKPLKGGGRIEALTLWNTKGSILSRGRHTLARKAVESGVSHLLMVDTDMTFPNWTLHQLLQADKDIVAANCVTKSLPALPTARQKSDAPAGKLVDSFGKKGLEEVWRVGTGVMLIKTSVFARIPQPWFSITWHEENDDYTGEDWNFCKVCQEAGIKTYIDHELSQHIGHVGTLNYNINHTAEESDEQK